MPARHGEPVQSLQMRIAMSEHVQQLIGDRRGFDERRHFRGRAVVVLTVQISSLQRKHDAASRVRTVSIVSGASKVSSSARPSLAVCLQARLVLASCTRQWTVQPKAQADSAVCADCCSAHSGNLLQRRSSTAIPGSAALLMPMTWPVIPVPNSEAYQKSAVGIVQLNITAVTACVCCHSE